MHLRVGEKISSFHLSLQQTLIERVGAHLPTVEQEDGVAALQGCRIYTHSEEWKLPAWQQSDKTLGLLLEQLGLRQARLYRPDHFMRTPEEEEEDLFFWSFTTIKQQPACLDYEQRRRLRPISISKIHHLGLKDNKKSVKR